MWKAMLIQTQSPRLFSSGVSHASVVFHHEEYTEGVAARFDVRIPVSMSQAVAKRRAEYVAGRFCAANAARALLGSFNGQIDTSTHGAPVWPAGLIGSITHTAGFASSALAPTSVARGLGLDTERIMCEAVMLEIGPIICSSVERFPLRSGLSRTAYTTLVFSAKESVFKCLYPLVGKLFSFEHSRIEIIDAVGGAFQATLTTDLGEDFRSGTVVEGRFSVAPPYVHTGVLLAP
jgi:enterobactin synthetase component D